MTASGYGDRAYPPQAVVEDEVDHADARTQIARVIALAAAAVVTIIGIVALVRIDWGAASVSSPVVEVASLTFTPVVAVVTTALGLVLLAVGAGRYGAGRLASGVVVLILGIVTLVVGQTRWHVSNRLGWLGVLVGAAFIITGLLTEGHVFTRSRRTYRAQEPV